MIDLDAVDAQLAALPTAGLARDLRALDPRALKLLEAHLTGEPRAFAYLVRRACTEHRRYGSEPFEVMEAIRSAGRLGIADSVAQGRNSLEERIRDGAPRGSGEVLGRKGGHTGERSRWHLGVWELLATLTVRTWERPGGRQSPGRSGGQSLPAACGFRPARLWRRGLQRDRLAGATTSNPVKDERIMWVTTDAPKGNGSGIERQLLGEDFVLRELDPGPVQHPRIDPPVDVLVQVEVVVDLGLGRVGHNQNQRSTNDSLRNRRRRRLHRLRRLNSADAAPEHGCRHSRTRPGPGRA
jgi:hypothetical protein